METKTELKHYAVSPSPCPHCGNINTAACETEATNGPSPGDFSVCAACGELCCFGEYLQLCAVPPEVIEALEPDFAEYLAELQRTTKDLIRARKNPVGAATIGNARKN